MFVIKKKKKSWKWQSWTQNDPSSVQMREVQGQFLLSSCEVIKRRLKGEREWDFRINLFWRDNKKTKEKEFTVSCSCISLRHFASTFFFPLKKKPLSTFMWQDGVTFYQIQFDGLITDSMIVFIHGWGYMNHESGDKIFLRMFEKTSGHSLSKSVLQSYIHSSTSKTGEYWWKNLLFSLLLIFCLSLHNTTSL